MHFLTNTQSIYGKLCCFPHIWNSINSKGVRKVRCHLINFCLIFAKLLTVLAILSVREREISWFSAYRGPSREMPEIPKFRSSVLIFGIVPYLIFVVLSKSEDPVNMVLLAQNEQFQIESALYPLYYTSSFSVTSHIQ